ncbi:MAG TPA: hypothetical protein VJA19_22415 [Pseudomonas sp.]|nr:hypothetical protein [Pseudomonas sp.]
MPPEPEFAPEYSRVERIRLVLGGTLAGALLVYGAQTWLFPGIKAFATLAPCRQVLGIDGLTVLWYGLFVGLPLHVAVLMLLTFGWQGYKVLRDGQFPAAGTKVYRPTRIRRGRKARLIGYLHLAAVLPCLLLAGWGAPQAEALSTSLRPPAGFCASAPV